MKKLTAVFVVLIIIVLVSAEFLKEDDLEKMPLVGIEYTWMEEEQAYSVTDGDGINVGNVRIIIPREYNGYPVTKIEPRAFSNLSGEVFIDIPDSVTVIGSGAFANCDDVVKIYISASVKQIGDGAFTYCSNLNEIIVSPDNPYYHSKNNCLINTTGEVLLLGCANSIIPTDGSVTAIANAAFANCSIQKLTIPNTVTYIGNCVFWGATIGEITMSSSVAYIEYDAFSGDYITLSAPKESYAAKWAIEKAYKVSYIDDYYEGEVNLETYDLSFYLMSDNTYAIIGVRSDIDADVILPRKYQGIPVTVIADSAFLYCTKLETIEVSTSITAIGNMAFKNCTNLKSIVLPQSVKSIGVNAFFGCFSLKEVNLPDSITYIAEYAFNSCTNLEKVTVSGSVTSLENGVFSDCKNLSEVVIPSSVTQIHDYAFYGCNQFTIYTDKGSYAEQWGIEHGYPVKIR